MEAKPERGRGAEELVAVSKTYDLVREMTPRVGKSPRDQEFLLGDWTHAGSLTQRRKEGKSPGFAALRLCVSLSFRTLAND